MKRTEFGGITIVEDPLMPEGYAEFRDGARVMHCRVDDAGVIDISETYKFAVYRWIINTHEKACRDALIALGWTPPPAPSVKCDRCSLEGDAVLGGPVCMAPDCPND